MAMEDAKITSLQWSIYQYFAMRSIPLHEVNMMEKEIEYKAYEFFVCWHLNTKIMTQILYAQRMRVTITCYIFMHAESLIGHVASINPDQCHALMPAVCLPS